MAYKKYLMSNIAFYALRLTVNCVNAEPDPVAASSRTDEEVDGSVWINPSHGISSPWPSFSNLHVFTEEKKNTSIYVWPGGGELHVLPQVPSKESETTFE